MTLQQLFEQEKCTPEERQAVADYLAAIRIMKLWPDMHRLFFDFQSMMRKLYNNSK